MSDYPTYDDAADREAVSAESSLDTSTSTSSKTSEAASATSTRSARSGRSKRPSKRDVATVIDAYERFNDLAADDAAIIATMLDCEPTARDLTVASLASSGNSASSVATILEWRQLAVTSEMEATLAVMSATEDRKAIKPIWGILHGLSLVRAEPGRGRFDTVRDLVQAVSTMSDEQSAQIERARDLLN